MNRIEQDKMFFDEAKRQITELKEQNKKMYEALKEVQSDINIVGEVSKKNLRK